MVSTYEGIYEVIVSRLQQILRKIVFSKLFTKKIKKKQKYMSYGLSKVNDFPYFSIVIRRLIGLPISKKKAKRKGRKNVTF